MSRFRSLFVASSLFFLVLAPFARAVELLPGFRVEELARADGFVSSVVTDSKGTIYLTTLDGWIQRVDGAQVTKVASLPTLMGGNGGLLGMMLLDDNTAVVHYTTWKANQSDPQPILDDVVSRVDLRTGAETVLRTFVGDIRNRLAGVSSEHHGGNPTAGPDGSVLVAIGEYHTYTIAQLPEWNGGKIWQINPANGEATQYALGMRNPYDLAWDPDLQRVVVGENGEQRGDEIHVLARGGNGGWPNTYLNPDQPPPAGYSPPVYTFPMTVAPVGVQRLDGRNAMLRSGYLIGGFVTSSIFYFPVINEQPLPDPIPLLRYLSEFMIDVTEAPNGDILFVSAKGPTSSVNRLHLPARGDCNGDSFVDWRDFYPLVRETRDGEVHPMITAQAGDFAGSWGCDVNADGLISAADVDALAAQMRPRRRAIR